MKGKWFIALALSSLFALLSFGFARVSFGIQDFSTTDLSDAEQLDTLCGPNATSFWCELRGQNLKLITTKSADYIFDQQGEVVALYAKQQRGQDLNGKHNLDNNQNLIPYTAPIPGSVVLINGEYLEPQNATSNWQQIERNGDPTLRGEFSYETNGFQVNKTILVSSVRNTMNVSLTVARTEAGQEPVTVQYAYPGIGRQDAPVIKVGQGENFTLNPAPQPVQDPSYISLQNANNNRQFAIVMRPNPNAANAEQDLTALPISADEVAFAKALPPAADASVNFDVQVYGGPNEMVRYLQEDYLDLPGLFRPNILGRVSLGIIIALQTIHSFVGSWGLSIILLTLLFRILVWPLIATQTKSMMGMQQLQPKLQALQKKHKDNREKLTEETMKLYKEAGVNPAGGCLPILVQMPIFIVLWRVFINFEFNEGFLWLPDLGLSDPYYILPLLYVAVMAVQAYLSAQGNMQSLRQQLLMSGIFVFFIFNFPAGVTLYLITSMAVQGLQQFLIKRTISPPAATAQAK